MKYFLLGLLFFASTSVSLAQADQKSKAILDKISADIKSLNSFYIEFDMQTKNASTGENSNQKGSGYVKGTKYFANIDDLTLISNGIKSWTVIKDEKVTYQNDVDEDDDDAITPKKLMTIWEKGFKSKYDKEVSLDGKKLHQISLFPVQPGKVNYHTITLFVTQSNELYRAIMKTKDGTTMTYTIKKFEKNKRVEDSKFVYNPQAHPGFQLIRD